MRKLIFLFITLFALVGCGGGATEDDSTFDGNFPSENFTGTSYDMWNYIVPDTTTPENTSVSSRGLDTTYNANFRAIDNNTVVEIPVETTDEKVEYKQLDDKISITFKKNDIPTFSYDIKKSVKLQEQTTVKESACMLVNHFETKTVNGVAYYDVIEIDCGQHKGFYAKGKGEIAQE